MGGCCAVVQSKRRKEMMAMQKKIESGGSSGVGNSGDGILGHCPYIIQQLTTKLLYHS